jgi:hypothetical protein
MEQLFIPGMSSLAAEARRGVVRVTGRLTNRVYQFSVLAPGYQKWMPDGSLMFACTGANLDVWDVEVGVQIEDGDGTLARARLPPMPPLVLRHVVTTPHDKAMFNHQRRMVSMSTQRDVFGVFHDMGTGKSATAIWMACELFAADEIDQLLFVTVTNNVDQFISEQVPLHAPKTMTFRTLKIPSPNADKLPAVSGKVLTIGVCGVGAFQGDKSFAAVQKFALRGRTLLILDESTNFKGWSSKRVKNMLALRDRITKIYLMSGEPAPQGLEDLFVQFYILDPRILGHASMTSFRNEYCIMGGVHNAEVLGYKNRDRLYSKIAPHCEFVNIADCQDMPQQVFVEKKFKAVPEQKRLYKQVLDEWIAVLDSGDQKLIETAASKYIALQTISNGWLKLDDGTSQVITFDRAKMVFDECQTDDKVIIWCRFHDDIELLKAVCPDKFVTFYGKQDQQTNTDMRIEFQTNPDVKYFIATAASGGTALNLQVAHHMIYFSNSYNFNDRSQSERRIWRTGQTERCVYADIIGLPIDRQILYNLRSKRDLSTEIRTIAGQKALALQLMDLGD